MGAALEKPLISVIIPAFERQATLTAAVASVKAQEGLGDAFHIELLIIDDASPTPQGQDLSFEGLSGRIERHDENQGPSAARNTGVSLATGNYLAFLDSDDIWRPQKLIRQLAKAKTLDTDGVWALATGFHIKRSRTQQWEDLIPVDITAPADFLKGCRHSPGTTSFLPRHVFDVVGPFDAALARLEDYDWYARFGRAGGKLFVVPEVLADIDPSNSVAKDKVLRALNQIDAKHTAAGLNPSDIAVMRAYLMFERGATLLRAGDRLGGALALARSFLLHPRSRPHLAPITTKPAATAAR